MNCEPCNSLEVTCNHNVTIGYLKNLVNVIPSDCCTSVSVTGSNDTYCPTYGELTGGTIIPYFSDGGTNKWSNNVDGITISQGYSENQCVAKKDLKLIYTAFESLTISNPSPIVSECGGSTTTTKTLTFRKYTKECDKEPTSTTQVDTILGATWSGTDAATSGKKTFSRNTSFTNTHSTNVSCSISWRGCSYTSNTIAVSQNVRQFDHNVDYPMSAATSLDVYCYPISFDCSGGTSNASATLYYNKWTERHYIDTCDIDYDAVDINLESKNMNVNSKLNATSHTYEPCTTGTMETTKFIFSATCEGLSDSAYCYMECNGCDICPPANHIDYTSVTANCSSLGATVTGISYTYSGGHYDASGNCVDYTETTANTSYTVSWNCSTNGGWVDTNVYVTGAPCCSSSTAYTFDDVSTICEAENSREQSVGYTCVVHNADGTTTTTTGTANKTIPAHGYNSTNNPVVLQTRIVASTLAAARPKITQAAGPCCPTGDVFTYDDVTVDCYASAATTMSVTYTQVHTNGNCTTTTTTGTNTNTPILARECNPNSSTRELQAGSTGTTLAAASPKITQAAGPCCSNCGCGNMERIFSNLIPQTGLTDSTLIITRFACQDSSCDWCPDWDAALFEDDGTTRICHCLVNVNGNNVDVVADPSDPVPANDDESGLKKDLILKLWNGGKLCQTVDVVQNGKANCTCEGLIDTEGSMVRSVNVIFDRDGSNGQRVVICSGNTYGCGELSAVTNSPMITDFQMTHPSDDNNKYEWSGIINSTSTDRTGDINFYYKDRFGVWLPCTEYILLMQGEGLYTCPTGLTWNIPSQITIPASGTSGVFNEAYPTKQIGTVSGTLATYTEGGNKLYGQMVMPYYTPCSATVEVYGVERDIEWINMGAKHDKYSNNVTILLGVAENLAEEDRECTVEVVSLCNPTNFYSAWQYEDFTYGAEWKTSYTNMTAVICERKTIKVRQLGKLACNKCSNMGLTLTAYTCTLNNNEIRISAGETDCNLSYKLYCGSITGVSITDLSGNPVSDASVSYDSSRITIHTDANNTGDDINYILKIRVQMSDGTTTTNCEAEYSVIKYGCDCSRFGTISVTGIPASDSAATFSLEVPCNEGGTGYTFEVPTEFTSCNWISSVTITQTDNYTFVGNVTFTGKNETASDRSCSFYITARYNGSYCERFQVSLTQNKKDDNCDECREIMDTITGGTDKRTFEWDEPSRCDGKAGQDNPTQMGTPWALCMMKTSAKFDNSGCHGGALESDYMYSAVTNSDKFAAYAFYNDVFCWVTGDNSTTNDYTGTIYVYLMKKVSRNTWAQVKDENNLTCSTQFTVTQKHKPSPPPTPESCETYGCDCAPSSMPTFSRNPSISAEADGTLILSRNQSNITIGSISPISDICYTAMCVDCSCLSYAYENGSPGIFDVVSIDSNGNIYVNTGKPSASSGTYSCNIFISYNGGQCTYFKNMLIIKAKVQ